MKKQNHFQELNSLSWNEVGTALLVIVGIFSSLLVSGASCTNSMDETDQSTNDQFSTVTLIVDCNGANTQTAVTVDLSNMSGNGPDGSCGGGFSAQLFVNGTAVTFTCGLTNYDISAHIPVTSVGVRFWDDDGFPDQMTYDLNVNVTHNSGGGLPIKLGYFEAELKNSRTFLEWMTASEYNNEYFTIERSENGLEFYEIATIKGKGNSTDNQYYSIVDEVSVKSIAYYRLKQTDFDGTYTYSKLVAVDCQEVEVQGGMEIFPNPFINRFKLLAHESEIIQVSVYDPLGKLILSLDSPENYQEVDLENLASIPGFYLVSIQLDGEIINHKLLKL